MAVDPAVYHVTPRQEYGKAIFCKEQKLIQFLRLVAIVELSGRIVPMRVEEQEIS